MYIGLTRPPSEENILNDKKVFEVLKKRSKDGVVMMSFAPSHSHAEFNMPFVEVYNSLSRLRLNNYIHHMPEKFPFPIKILKKNEEDFFK